MRPTFMTRGHSFTQLLLAFVFGLGVHAMITKAREAGEANERMSLMSFLEEAVRGSKTSAEASQIIEKQSFSVQVMTNGTLETYLINRPDNYEGIVVFERTGEPMWVSIGKR